MWSLTSADTNIHAFILPCSISYGVAPTLASDTGKELAGHAEISERPGSGFYFFTPYHSWQRGLNENTNGLVRQYFPKGTYFAKLSATDVQRVEDLLNTRPRKALNYHSPNEVFAKLTDHSEKYALGM